MLTNIFTILSNFWRSIINTFETIVILVTGVFQYVDVLRVLTGYLPAIISSFILVSVAILIAKFILGRGNS